MATGDLHPKLCLDQSKGSSDMLVDRESDKTHRQTDRQTA